MLNYKQIWHGIKPIRWLNKFNLTPFCGNLSDEDKDDSFGGNLCDKHKDDSFRNNLYDENRDDY